MAIGPGKYDDLCTLVREKAKARAVIVIIIGGEHGEGFSVQTEDPFIILRLPLVLERVAASIRTNPFGGGRPAKGESDHERET
jgi:hypothetical protein